MENPQVQLLWSTFQKTRDLSKYYISLMKECNPYQTFQFNGQKLNSLCWMVCHLTWAEDFLIVRSTGGQGVGIPWLESYALGCNGELHEGKPDFKTMLDTLKTVHSLSETHLKNLADSSLDETNVFGFAFAGDNTKRMMLQHAIRHEGTHVGQLGWLVKLNGLKAI